MSFKPSESEEEYFARKEFERKKKIAEEQMKSMGQEEKERLKSLHYMHCPRCGMELVEVKYRGVEVDECPSCGGFWLDSGEIEKIVTEKDTLLSGILKIFK